MRNSRSTPPRLPASPPRRIIIYASNINYTGDLFFFLFSFLFLFIFFFLPTLRRWTCARGIIYTRKGPSVARRRRTGHLFAALCVIIPRVSDLPTGKFAKRSRKCPRVGLPGTCYCRETSSTGRKWATTGTGIRIRTVGKERKRSAARVSVKSHVVTEWRCGGVCV